MDLDAIQGPWTVKAAQIGPLPATIQAMPPGVVVLWTGYANGVLTVIYATPNNYPVTAYQNMTGG